MRERNTPSFEIISNQGVEEMDINLKDVLPNIFGQRTKKRKMNVAEAFEYLEQEEEGGLIDMDQVTRLAVERVENSGIIFLDEIDKIAGREGGHGPDVSREGVQRDILPIVEGTTSIRAMGWCGPTISCLSPQGPSMSPSRVILSLNSRAGFPSAWSCSR